MQEGKGQTQQLKTSKQWGAIQGANLGRNKTLACWVDSWRDSGNCFSNCRPHPLVGCKIYLVGLGQHYLKKRIREDIK